MGFARTARWIMNHPLNRRHKVRAMSRYFAWQLRSRLGSGPRIVPFVGGARLLVRRGMTGATGNIYAGLAEFEEMGFVLHALRADDTFIDVGANVGAYTVLACAGVGARGLAFEPVPSTFACLRDNLRLNQLDSRVVAHNCGVARQAGSLRFTSDVDTTNHVIPADAGRPTGGEAAANDRANDQVNDQAQATLEVPVVPLDDFVDQFAPAVIKIDVEGFETEVVAGAGRMLQGSQLRAVIMELNGSGTRYGYDESALHQTMLGFGFRPCRYDPFTRALCVETLDSTTEAARSNTGNSLYVRDRPAVEQRLRSAQAFSINGQLL